MSLIVTAAQHDAADGILLRVHVLTGVAGTQDGARAFASHAGFTADQYITTTKAGSVVFGALLKKSEIGPLTAVTGTTLDDNLFDSALSNSYGTCQTAPTVIPSRILVGASAPSGIGIVQVALAEILPNGTITEDASAPPPASSFTGTTVTTDSFSPPSGSLLLAVTSSNGIAAGKVQVTTDGLTWTPLVQTEGAGYAGIWTATAP